MTTNKSVNFKVNGMHCDGCANKIRKGLEVLNIENVTNISIEKSLVNIQFNSSQSTIAALKDSITQAGFQVESVIIE